MTTASISSSAFKKSIIAFIILFLGTFAARTIYELLFTGRDLLVTYTQDEYRDYDVEYSEKGSYDMYSNIASERFNQKDLDGQSVQIDQKYEKTANITASSDDFSNDYKKLREIIDQNNAVIQMENLSGLAGHQMLDMTIGVTPGGFDGFLALIKEIGRLEAFNSNTVDKTSEYRELMAQMETLQESIDSYSDMKEGGGDIKDLLLLEDKILETRQRIQDLGVNLGSFDSENSFCTINFSMTETAPVIADGNISIRFVLSCIKRAFFWTMYLFVILFAFAIGSLFGIWLMLKGYSNVKSQLSLKSDKVLPEEQDDDIWKE